MVTLRKSWWLVVLFLGLSVPFASSAGKMDMGSNSQMKMEIAPNHQMAGTAEEQVICPVTGSKFKPTKQSPSYEYKGKTYQFCCPGCVEMFKKNPEKYLSRIK